MWPTGGPRSPQYTWKVFRELYHVFTPFGFERRPDGLHRIAKSNYMTAQLSPSLLPVASAEFLSA